MGKRDCDTSRYTEIPKRFRSSDEDDSTVKKPSKDEPIYLSEGTITDSEVIIEDDSSDATGELSEGSDSGEMAACSFCEEEYFRDDMISDCPEKTQICTVCCDDNARYCVGGH